MSKETKDVVSVMLRAKEEIESMRQQLADSQKREVMLRDALRHLWNERTPDSYDEAGEALSATADLDGLILCHADPVALINHDLQDSIEWIDECYELADGMKLFSAWEPTK